MSVLPINHFELQNRLFFGGPKKNHLCLNQQSWRSFLYILNCTTNIGSVTRTNKWGKIVGYAPCNIGMNILNAKVFIAKLMMNNSAFGITLLPTKSK